MSSIVSLSYVYYATVLSELRRVDEDILTEIRELEALYRTEGPITVQGEVILRMTSGEGLYLFRTENFGGRPIMSGNINEFPEADNKPRIGLLQSRFGNDYRTVEFELTFRDSEASDLQARRSRAIASPLKIDERVSGVLIVGRDVEPTMRNAERIRTAILTSAVLAMILGLLSGWYVSRRFTRRVEHFNKLATDVRAGHLDRRAPRNYSEDELDLLAEHLNSMLDHIDRLMKAMRYAGDSIAHDLRSPLTRLRTRLESAASEIKDPTSSDVLYSAAGDAAELLRTFDSVLRIARLETGERRELLVSVDPKPILDDIAELYEPACDEAGLSFSADIASGARIMADRGLISQAVSNLVENAIKYTPVGGTIKLTLRRNKFGRTEISVQDDGPGIPDADRERVKDRFVRLDQSRTLPGSGLGLAMVDAIADLHRADFDLTDGLKRPQPILNPKSDPTEDKAFEYTAAEYASRDWLGLTARLTFPRAKTVKTSPSKDR